MQVEGFADRPIQHENTPFLDRLSLKRLDRDIFTGWCHAGAPLRAFGGQVAAQALVAAGTTVNEPDRRVHSLHSYFLRPGRTTDHIVYMVDRPRDGRSFSTRRVKAVQYGETIFTMSASFVEPMEGPAHQATDMDKAEPPPGSWLATLPSPKSLPETDLLAAVAANETDPEVIRKQGFPAANLIDIRFVPDEQTAELTGNRYDQLAWVKSVDPLPDSPLVHSCAVTYFSDLSLVGTMLGHHGGRSAAAGHDLASIDHAMWFHHGFAGDDWLLFATDSPISGHGHGFTRGQFFTRSGVLAVSAAQEVLYRVSRR